MKKYIDTIIKALDQHQGDNAARARLAFKNCTLKEMQEEYGQSGETRQAILDGYEKREKDIEDARVWIQNLEHL